MTKQDPWFFEVRAEAFVSLVLTKQNDVRVVPDAGPLGDMALDLRVEILKGGKSISRYFYAQMIPYLDLPDMESVESAVASHGLTLERNPVEEWVPICVFAVGVRKPEGIYRWSLEPVVADGQASLRECPEANWQTLDEQGADRLIAQVNAWYDARNRDSTPKAQRRHSKTESG
jgi:hypothetical protein